jgi:16S rRNA (guanine(966)-N(2))-methyltransferase RsmD
MRVIAGSARGLRLAAPKDPQTRPISDRVKESLFGALGRRVEASRFLDLYAGSGAIGIEALSRGAAHATFVERARPAVAVIRENLDRTGLADRATVRATAVEPFLASAPGGPWDVVVLDPPYAERTLDLPLERLRPHLAPGAVVVVKHFWRTPMPAGAGLAVTRSRRFGETALTFLEEER